MSPSDQTSVLRTGAREKFPPTHWSHVLAAGRRGGADEDEALAKLCSAYRYPLYAFVRRSGKSHEDAEDLTQSFFAHLLDKQVLNGLAPGRGKFRTFLLASLKNFLANHWDKAHAAKRGGKHTILSLDEESHEGRYLREPSHNATPDRLFEQSWALTVIETALGQLREEYRAAGKSEMFEALQDRLIGAEDSGSYAELAAKLNMGEGAVRMTVLRMRRHFGYLLRAQIAGTVGNPAEIEEELRHLINSTGRS